MTIKKVNNIIKNIIPQLWERRGINAHLHCTVALKGGNIIAYGFNNYKKTHPANKFGKYISSKNNTLYNANIHSEIDLIKKIQFREDLHKITLLNIRLGMNKEKMISMPCHNCLKVLHRYNFKAIYYTIDESKIGKITWKNMKK